MKGWYWGAINRMPPPARVTLERITVERVDLYCHIPTHMENIPVSVEPFQVDEMVPTEDNIEWAVKRQPKHRSTPPSGMHTEHLKG